MSTGHIEIPVATMDEGTARELRAFVESITQTNIDVVKVVGERQNGGESATTNFQVQAGYQPGEGVLFFRFDAEARILGPDDQLCAVVAGGVVVGVTTPESPSAKVAELFGTTTATVMAYPFLRELVAATAQRIGYQGILMPMVINAGEGANASLGDDARAAAAEPHI